MRGSSKEQNATSVPLQYIRSGTEAPGDGFSNESRIVQTPLPEQQTVSQKSKIGGATNRSEMIKKRMKSLEEAPQREKIEKERRHSLAGCPTADQPDKPIWRPVGAATHTDQIVKERTESLTKAPAGDEMGSKRRRSGGSFPISGAQIGNWIRHSVTAAVPEEDEEELIESKEVLPNIEVMSNSRRQSVVDFPRRNKIDILRKRSMADDHKVFDKGQKRSTHSLPDERLEGARFKDQKLEDKEKSVDEGPPDDQNCRKRRQTVANLPVGVKIGSWFKHSIGKTTADDKEELLEPDIVDKNKSISRRQSVSTIPDGDTTKHLESNSPASSPVLKKKGSGRRLSLVAKLEGYQMGSKRRRSFPKTLKGSQINGLTKLTDEESPKDDPEENMRRYSTPTAISGNRGGPLRKQSMAGAPAVKKISMARKFSIAAGLEGYQMYCVAPSVPVLQGENETNTLRKRSVGKSQDVEQIDSSRKGSMEKLPGHIDAVVLERNPSQKWMGTGQENSSKAGTKSLVWTGEHISSYSDPEKADNVTRTEKVSPSCSRSSSWLSLQNGLVKQGLAVAGMSLGCVLDGTVIAYSSPALPSLSKQSSTVQINLHHASWIGSVHTLGAVLGCLLSIPTMTLLGRRGAALYVMTVAYLLGYLLIGLAVNVEMIIIGRLLGGIGLGLTLSITPVYLVEVSNISNRGMLGVIPPLFTQVGLLTTYISGIWLEWAGLALSGIALIVPTILFIWVIPESPVHLASKGDFMGAEQSLQKLGRTEAPTGFFKQVQGETLHYSGPDVFENTEDANSSPSWRFHKHPAVWKPSLVCLAIMFFFQATGYNTIIAYSKLIFKESGLTMNEHIATGITGGVILVSCIAAIGLSKLLRRKLLLLASSIGTSINLIILGVYYYLKGAGVPLTCHWVPLVSMLVFISFFMVGYGAVAWTVMAEILPTSARGKLYPFAVAFTWICNFCFALSFGYIQEYSGSFSAFWCFAGLSFIGAIFIVFCVPETKDKSPEEIAEFFVKKTPVVLNSTATSVMDISSVH